MKMIRRLFILLGLVTLVGVLNQRPAMAGATTEPEATALLQKLYTQNDKAKMLGERSKAILVFPTITKGGLIVGGESGNGMLLERGKAAGNYNISAGSVGLQIGGQQYSLALFMMTDAAISALKNGDGWSVGTGPSVVALDEGAAKELTPETMRSDVYVMTFGQKGLMAGVDLKGSKITRTGGPAKK
jgi:lipid-binding SYLF domain-containing protein